MRTSSSSTSCSARRSTTSHAAAAELSRRLRAGELDDRIDELAPRLEEHVRRKLEIARPGYDA